MGKVFNATNERNPLAYVRSVELRTAPKEAVRGLPRLFTAGVRYQAPVGRGEELDR